MANRTSVRLAAWTGLLLAASMAVGQQDPQAYFKQNCASCHSIGGGRLTGPDLKDVTARKDRAWLTRFLQNPPEVINSGDAYAMKLRDEARGVVMPVVPGMSPQVAGQVLDLIEAESKLPRSRFAGSMINDRPLTAADVTLGGDIFFGRRALTNGGSACFSCHTLKDAGGLGGGRLGPDLTLAFERLQGRKGLTTWLAAPPSPTMQPEFRTRALTEPEILALTAYMEDAAKRGGRDDSPSLLTFFLLGLTGTVVAMVGVDKIWKRRLRGVRRPMVEAAKKERR